MTDAMTRRTFAGSIGAALAAGATMQARAAEAPPSPAAVKRWQNGTSPWPLCLDTATIRPASLEEKIRIAAKVGFDAIEPWEGELHEYEEKGGSLADLGKRIRDAGLFVPSVIGLWNAIPATREEFDKSLVDSRRRMRQAAAVGAEYIQVVPQPARPWQEFDPKWAADRYRELLRKKSELDERVVKQRNRQAELQAKIRGYGHLEKIHPPNGILLGKLSAATTTQIQTILLHQNWYF